MKTEHTRLVCDKQHDDGGVTCMFCEGGLFACTVCGAFEGATPDHCPGVRMTAEQSDAVYAGTLNFRDGQWREECCRVMRPVHDLDNYMAEEGYQRNPETGRWEKTEAEKKRLTEEIFGAPWEQVTDANRE